MVEHSGRDYTEYNSDTYAYVDPLKLDLNDKSVFITGASKGIGAAIAKSFARAGASYIGVGARSTTNELVQAIKNSALDTKRPEPQVFSYTTDVTDPASVAATSDQFSTDAQGHLDVLVNNAGYLSKGLYLITKYFLPIMLGDDKSDRTIVNMSSAGAHALINGGSGYETSKFAQLQFSEFIGIEYGNQGVLSYVLHPGSVLTEMGQKFSSDVNMPFNDTPEVCADTIAFLTSEKRHWLQGRYLSCTWDMEEVMKREENIVQSDYLKTRMKIGMPTL